MIKLNKILILLFFLFGVFSSAYAYNDIFVSNNLNNYNCSVVMNIAPEYAFSLKQYITESDYLNDINFNGGYSGDASGFTTMCDDGTMPNGFGWYSSIYDFLLNQYGGAVANSDRHVYLVAEQYNASHANGGVSTNGNRYVLKLWYNGTTHTSTVIQNTPTYIELYPQISTAGVISDVLGCPSGITNIRGIRNFSGVYNTGAQITIGAGATHCGIYTGMFGYTMENGFANGGVTTPDGNYYTFITGSGADYQPDWTTGASTIYYWSAIRTNGLWYSGGYVPPPVETCFDGILNQNETATDKGGICFYVALNWPENATTVPDFAQWTATTYGNDTSATGTLQRAVMWSDDGPILNTCLNYPTSPADYSACFLGVKKINIDYGNKFWASISEYRDNIDKTGTLISGRTYFARAVVYSIDENTLNRDVLLSYSDIISFNVDSIQSGDNSGACSGVDIPCILKAVFRWSFIPSESSLTQFGNFKILLESKAPFGYAIGIYNSMTTLHYDANAPVVVLEQVAPITTFIFEPLKIGLSWLLWFAFTIMLLKRFRDIQI